MGNAYVRHTDLVYLDTRGVYICIDARMNSTHKAYTKTYTKCKSESKSESKSKSKSKCKSKSKSKSKSKV